MNRATYTISRRGTFFANLHKCDQCGGAGQKTFEFEAELTVEDLDEHGFTADNRSIPDIFDRWQRGLWQASCEELAAGGLLGLHAVAAGRAVAIQVRIVANGDSFLQVNWVEGQALPGRQPRRVTVPSQHEIEEGTPLLV